MNYFILYLLLFFISTYGYTQMQAIPYPNYWVTEVSSRSDPYSIVRLYNQKDEPIWEILIKRIRLNPACQQVKRALEKLAEISTTTDITTIVTGKLLNINPQSVIVTRIPLGESK